MQAALKEARCSREPAPAVSARSRAAVPQGWFSLARARYQMGAGSVGQLQYDQNMRASVRLTQNQAEWSLLAVEEEDASESTLRRRRPPPGEAGKPGATPPRLPLAPLRWFAGPMPPPALRSAQQQFWKALELAVESSNSQRRLTSLLEATPVRVEKEAASGEQDSEGTESAAGTEGGAASTVCGEAGEGKSEPEVVSTPSMHALSLSGE